MTTIYKAIDGTIFQNKEKCAIYENDLMKRIKFKLRFIDVDKNNMEISPENLKKCFYIFVRDEGLDLLLQLGKEENYTVPTKNGLWRWARVDPNKYFWKKL